MPVSFTFTDPATWKTVTLDEADRVACELSGAVYSAKTFCGMFQLAQIIGTSPRVQNESGDTDETKLREYLGQPSLELRPDQQEALVELMCKRFRFSAWWQARG